MYVQNSFRSTKYQITLKAYNLLNSDLLISKYLQLGIAEPEKRDIQKNVDHLQTVVSI